MGTAPGRTEEKRSGAPLRRGGVPQKIYWEGINLNKISKKIVSLVTMAAFALTLVPAAAFAAPTATSTEAASAAESSFTVSASTVGIDEPTTVDVTIKDANGDPTSAILDNVRIWVTKEGSDAVVKNVNINNWSMTDGVVNGRLANDQDFTVSFAEVGDYIIHIGQLQTLPGGGTTVEELSGKGSVNVNEVVNSIVLGAKDAIFENGSTEYRLLGTTDDVTIDLDKADLLPNSIIEYTLTGDVYKNFVPDKNPGSKVAGESFNVASNSDNLILTSNTVTSGSDGSFELSFKVAKAGSYKITLSNSDVNYTINVNYKTSNDDIETVVSDGETMLAGTDTKNYNGNNTPADDSAAVQFQITNNEGGIVTGADALDKEPAAHATGVTDSQGRGHSSYLEIVNAPEGSKIAASDLILVSNGEYYTLKYVGNNAAQDLVPGEYEVKVSLLSGEYATAKMTFANYGTTQDVVLDMSAVPYNGAGEAVQSETITDQVKLGRTVTVQAKYVDENGVKINAQDAVYGFEGKAVDNKTTTSFNTKPDFAYNETYIGSTITVTAVDTSAKQLASAELTVVDSYSENSLAFDKDNGLVDTDNNVTVSVVDEDGNVVPVKGELLAYVEDQSNADADVTVEVAKDMTNGKDGKLILNSDKNTTADIVVAVKAQNAIYAGTLHYTFGEVTGVGTTVVMFIGSTDTIVNNETVTIDAAPYVENDRTYVPLRALAQDFGAEVNWDEETGDITIVADGNTVVLKVGETTYTVNGEERTMDVAPVLDSDANRTLVPVRFVAEALGYSVTAISAADGTTACVYFTL